MLMTTSTPAGKDYILYVGHDPYCVVAFPYADTLRPVVPGRREGNLPKRGSKKNAMRLDLPMATEIATNLSNRMFRIEIRDAVSGRTVQHFEPAKDYAEMVARQTAKIAAEMTKGRR